MVTLNQIATSILNEVGQQTNHELLERIKDRVRFLATTIMKREIDKYSYADDLVVPLRFKLEKVTIPTGCTTGDCFVLQTTTKLPSIIRTVNKPIFNYIGSIDSAKPFYYTTEFNIPMLLELPIYKLTIFVTYVGGKLRVYNNTALEYIQVNMMLLDKSEYTDLCDIASSCGEDEYFSVPYDIIDSIIRTLVEEFLKVNNIASAEEIKITK